MELISQRAALEDLHRLADANKHSILIEGSEGCGKSYIAKQYATMLDIVDFQVVEPKVQCIKEAINSCYVIDNPIVLYIENLDTGVLAASYALLKFLEEPSSHVYIVITCRNLQNICYGERFSSVSAFTESSYMEMCKNFQRCRNYLRARFF